MLRRLREGAFGSSLAAISPETAAVFFLNMSELSNICLFTYVITYLRVVDNYRTTTSLRSYVAEATRYQSRPVALSFHGGGVGVRVRVRSVVSGSSPVLSCRVLSRAGQNEPAEPRDGAWWYEYSMIAEPKPPNRRAVFCLDAMIDGR